MQNKPSNFPSPDMLNKNNLNSASWIVSLSLLPAGIAGVYIFGFSAFLVVLIAVLTAIFTEFILQKLTSKRISFFDGKAFLIGLLMGYNLPPNLPLWVPAAGSFFAICVIRFILGGLGKNIFNPVLAARAFVMAFWPQYLAVFAAPVYKFTALSYDAVTEATPLTALKQGGTLFGFSYWDLFLGRKGGCIGEVCVALLLVGAAVLILRKIISLYTPLSFILSFGIFIYIFGGKVLFSGNWLIHILSGGLILGAFFMATDYATSPVTKNGKIIFGFGCGILTAVIRIWGSYPEGVCYAILMMNIFVPLINRYTIKNMIGSRARVNSNH